MWPPDELWPRIAAVWSHANGPPSGERASAIVVLRQFQQQFDLSDAQVAYIAEYQTLDPGSRIVRRERAKNAFEVVLTVLGGVGLVMPFEHFVLDTAWILHSYVFHQFLHTPRWLIWSRGSGFGKTARLSCIRELAYNAWYAIAPNPAGLYHHIRKHPRTTLLLDDMENADLWNKRSLLRQIIDSGHRQGGQVPRVIKHDNVWFPTFAPLALGTIVDRDRLYKFPPQVLTRSTAFEMRQESEGQDQVFPDDPRFAPVRAVAAGWAETFQRPTVVNIPRGIMMRRADNWRVLIAIGDALGYGATLRAAAVAVEAANFDPQLRIYEDLYTIFEQRQEAGLWEDDILQALADIEGGFWDSLTKATLRDLLYPEKIERKTVWKDVGGGKRKSNKGYRREQLEPVWRKLGYGAQQAQSSKIIRLVGHKPGTGEAHDE
jgi:hypothetical protein